MSLPETNQANSESRPRSSVPILARRKTAHQLRVEQFMNRVREIMKLPPLPGAPQVPDGKMILAQAKLIWEETLEVLEACGIRLFNSVGNTPIQPSDLKLVMDEKAMLHLPSIAKELADLSVVTTGMFSEFGIADVPVLEEVDINNLTKFGPGGYLDENRKWKKPPNHPTPDIKQILVDQGWQQPEVSRE